MRIEERKQLFKNPSNEYKGKPFWSWNGDLKEDELKRQIDVMKEMGFGGYFMHSRTGLETEYLGEEWFRLTNECADYGDNYKMESWLYDEDRWPSGIAGGVVTKNEEYGSRYLVMKTYSYDEINDEILDSFNECKDIVNIFICKLDGSRYSNERLYTSGMVIEEGETLVLFYIRIPEGNEVYNGYTYLDTMNIDGVNEFIKVTHEAYKEKCGQRFGKSIKGIFTDEPHRGALFSTFSEGSEEAVPYTPLLFDRFLETFGYDLRPQLLELFLKKEEVKISKVTRDYIEMCQILFIDNFAKPYQSWCKENDLIFTGHVLHEDSLSAQTVMQGSLMRFYEYMDYPGIDLLAEQTSCYWIVKQVTSVARQLEKDWILSELYGCTGWQMDFEAYKNVGDWQALFGINLRCPHLSWYTMKGEAKRDYPASILHQSAWYKEYNYLEDYYSRIHVAMFAGEANCELLVLNPIESVWARSYSGAYNSLSAREEGIQRIEFIYEKVFACLASNRIDFDYGEEDIIARHGRVKDGRLYVGKVSYSKVLVAGMDTIRGTTLTLLQEFVKQGGVVVFAGEAPSYVDVIKNDDVWELAKLCVQIDLDEKDVATYCKSGTEIIVEGQGNEDIYAQVRNIEGGRIAMLLNMDRHEGRDNLNICLGVASYVELWDAKTGQSTCIDYYEKDGLLWIDTELERGEERLYYVTDSIKKRALKSLDDNLDIMEEFTPVIKKSCLQSDLKKQVDEFAYHLYEDNILVIDYVSVNTSQGEMIPNMEVLKADRMLRDMIGISYRSGNMLQPWYDMKYNINCKDVLRKITLEYSFSVETISSKVSLVVEDIENIKNIEINGQEIDIISHGKWIDICFDIIELNADMIKNGVNKINITMDYHMLSGMEAIYLLGDFGVYMNEEMKPYISLAQDKLRIGDITEQGLAFYSGIIGYYVEGCEDKTVDVIVDEYEGACLKLIGEEDTILAWPPLRAKVKGLKEIQLILNRRNTFGPLHAYPERAYAYGPENFLTSGEAFKDEYMLLPQGIMKAPSICTVAE